MSTSIATRPADQEIDQRAVLQALRLNPSDPNTQALVLTCNRYGLDPLLKHAVLIQGTLYVTRDGLMHVAHASGKFDGIQVRHLPETASHYVAEATVWRKDMGHPFVYSGRYPKGGRNGGPGKDFGPEMAEKVAECRALRRAFSIALCSREELWDREDAPEPVAVAPVTTYVRKPLNVAVKDFWQRADALGFVVRGEDGKVSSDLVSALAVRMLNGEVCETPEDWHRALVALDTPPPAVVEGEVVEAESDLAGIGDPFADAEEPGALLSVPADAPSASAPASPFVETIPQRGGRK